MSLDERRMRHCPLMLESDVIWLPKDFAISGVALQDIPLGVTHRMRPSAVALLFALHDKTTYRTLLRLARVQKISDSQLHELVGFLNMIGALERQRMSADSLRAVGVRMHHMLLGVWYTPIAWRRPATPLTTALGVLRAISIVVGAVCAVAAVAAFAGLAPIAQIAGISLFCITLFAGSLFVHEMVHVRVARRRYIRPRILQIGLRLGVIHRKLTPRREALSSICGPFAGSMVSAAAGIIALSVHAPLYGLAGALIALMHCLSLTPWYGDGASFYKALRERKSLCNK